MRFLTALCVVFATVTISSVNANGVENKRPVSYTNGISVNRSSGRVKIKREIQRNQDLRLNIGLNKQYPQGPNQGGPNQSFPNLPNGPQGSLQFPQDQNLQYLRGLNLGSPAGQNPQGNPQYPQYPQGQNPQYPQGQNPQYPQGQNPQYPQGQNPQYRKGPNQGGPNN